MLPDFERPLNERGERDAPRMARRMKEREIVIDLMVTSPALRTLSTCQRMAPILNYSASKIRKEPKLYHADEGQIMQVLRNFEDHFNTVFVCGHNPGLTEFADRLTGEYFNNIPTCGVVGCSLDILSWKDITWQSARLLFFDFPKSKVD